MRVRVSDQKRRTKCKLRNIDEMWKADKKTKRVGGSIWTELPYVGSFGELRIPQQEVIQGAKFCQSTNDLAVSSVPRVV